MIQGIGMFPVQYAVIASRGSKGNYLFDVWTQMWLQKKKPSREMCRSGLEHSQRMDGVAVPWISDIVEATEPQPGDEGLTASTISLTAASAGPGKANTRYPPSDNKGGRHAFQLFQSVMLTPLYDRLHLCSFWTVGPADWSLLAWSSATACIFLCSGWSTIMHALF